MFYGTIQAETTTIYVFGMTWTQLGIKPIKPLGQCWVSHIVIFYDQQGLLRELNQGPYPGPPQLVGLHSDHHTDCSIAIADLCFLTALVFRIITGKNPDIIGFSQSFSDQVGELPKLLGTCSNMAFKIRLMCLQGREFQSIT